MITRAQAEALLTLAESLEACERVGAEIQVPGRDHVSLMLGQEGECLELSRYSQLSGHAVRHFVADRLPKHTGS